MNSQQLELLRDLCVKELNNDLDKKTRHILSNILAQIEDDIKVLDSQEKRESNFFRKFNTQVDEMHEQQSEDIRLDNFRQDDTLNK